MLRLVQPSLPFHHFAVTEVSTNCRFPSNGLCWSTTTTTTQPALSWRASSDRQISLSASNERAFANFRVKNVVFTGTHFCAVLSMVGERAFVNFRKFVN